MEIELRGRTKSSSQDETMWWNSESRLIVKHFHCSGAAQTHTRAHIHRSGQPVASISIV